MEYWNHMAECHHPKLSFSVAHDWKAWSEEGYQKLLEVLGDFPETVDPDVEIEYSEIDGDLIRERVVFNTEQFMSIPCIVLRPRVMKADKSSAAILCVHGHGPYGKDPVAGIRSSSEMESAITASNYNYGEQMAKAGFLTLCPDLRGFGERRDAYDPIGGRDICNVNFIKGALFASYPLTLNIWDMMRCVDYLQTREEVNPERIGMMGLSQGGTVTAFTASVDRRIKAADIIAYVNPWAEFGIRHGNFCGSQVIPGIFNYFDTHDIAGLIAPRPLLIEMGLYDSCFPYQDLHEGYKKTSIIYQAAGAEDKLHADIHPSTHAFAGNKAFDFFKTYL
jgi:hypothetical protein